MRMSWLVAATASVALGVSPASAQGDLATLSAAEVAVACAPPATADGPPDHALHVIGAQDSVARTVYGNRDLLVVDGGMNAGIQLGQPFFVRRGLRFGMRYGSLARPSSVSTAGWIRIVAVNDTTAIATVEHACGAIFQNDYLDPFVAPSVAAETLRDDTSGEPDFRALGRVLSGIEDRRAAAPGEFVLIDRGSDQGVAPGTRVAVYRDLGVAGLPLMAIGEAVVVSAAKTRALTRITRARDAVQSGDYVAPRK